MKRNSSDKRIISNYLLNKIALQGSSFASKIIRSNFPIKSINIFYVILSMFSNNIENITKSTFFKFFLLINICMKRTALSRAVRIQIIQKKIGSLSQLKSTTVNYNDTIPTGTELMKSCISLNLIDKNS